MSIRAVEHLTSRRGLGLSALTVVLDRATSGQARAASAVVGSVEAVKGRAFAELSGTRALQPSGAIFMGDLVWTEPASAANLLLARTTTVDLGANAKLTIDRFVANAGGRLTLGNGAMLFDRPEDLPKVDLEVRTNYGLIAVRGTMFFAGPSRGTFGVFVERGQVVVNAAGQTRTLNPGDGIDIAQPGATPSAVRRWPPARVVEALASVRG
jgi:ferric-dicitrate binding protein FerR (iron transport regulator)